MRNEITKVLFINREQEKITAPLFSQTTEGAWEWKEKTIIENKPIGLFLLEFLNLDLKEPSSVSIFARNFGFPRSTYFRYVEDIKKKDENADFFRQQIQNDTFQRLRLFQSSLKAILLFCFGLDHSDKIHYFSAIKRYYLYQLQNPKEFDIINSGLDRRNIIRKDFLVEPEKPIPISSFENNLPGLLDFLGAVNINAQEIYQVTDLEDICLLELEQMLLSEIAIRPCKNCGRWFIPVGRSDAEYCERPISHLDNRTCRMIGPKKKFSDKLKEDPVASAYRKSYKKLHQRLKSTGPSHITEESFDQWKKEAKDKIDQFRNGEITLVEFTSWIKAAEEELNNN